MPGNDDISDESWLMFVEAIPKTKLTNLRCVAVVWLNTKHNSF